MKALYGTLLAGASTLALSLAWTGTATAQTVTLDGSAGKTSYTHSGTLTGGNGKAGTSGLQGAGGSGDWSSGIRVTGTNITVDVASGSVTGGVGGKGGDAASPYTGGSGGSSYGINVRGDRASVTVRGGATVSGGTSGDGGSGANGGNSGETAGLLVYGNDTTVVNQGTIQSGTSGTGGSARTAGGRNGNSLGSNAVRIGLGLSGTPGYVGDRTTLTNGGSILGRSGSGIEVYSADTAITNTGTISTDTGQAAILLAPGSGLTRITNRGTIVNSNAYDKDSRWAIGNFGAGAEITNYGTIKSQSYDASAISSTGKTSIVNYGTILGGIDTSARGDTLTFDGSQGGAAFSGGVWGNTEEANPTHATISFRNGVTEFVAAQGIDTAYDRSNRLRIGDQPSVTLTDLTAVSITSSNTVTIERGGELALSSANALINSDRGFVNNGVFNLGRRVAVIGGSVRDNPDGTVTVLPGGAISGSGVITTKVGSGQHGYIIATANRADDFSKMTVVPVVEGTGVKNGSSYVLVQNYAGTAAAPTVSKAGGFLWSSAVQTASGQVDSDGVSYGTANSSIIISASANELIAGAAGTSGAPVRALAAYMGPNPELAALSQAVNNLTSEAEVRKAGAQLSPETNGATAQAAMGAVNQALTTVQVRSDAVRTAMAGETGVATGDAPLTVGVWGQIFGSTATQGRRNGVDGYGSDTYGVAFGADGMVTDEVLTGVSLAYARTGVDAAGARTGSGQDIDSWIASLYGTYSAPSWYVDGALTLGWHAYDSTRVVNFAGIQPQTARASYNGFQYGAKAEVGVPLAVGGATVTPLASLAFSRLRQDGYSETGAPGANLSVEGTSTNSLRSGLGAKVSLGALPADGWTLTPTARAVWLHEFSSSAPDQTASFTAGSTPFTTTGTSPARDHANLGVGLDAALSGQVTLSARYDADLAQSYVGHSGSLQLRVKF
ncbi:outer membrane autotransporter protein [Azospirillum fermentarium]|uniref:autotransporter outer membrane beta-barrel domain-containing protein n=1 Tax=Azospirillum fermentarium TaxID=1233114 RepID=UPI00222765FA|nr:autotransporter outer membrane beta-barrel domain-containing protein [Azospirillum fermentarium]MCW2248245.1 outer membrane autotransporter protein [Azospirillum fermentarium]